MHELYIAQSIIGSVKKSLPEGVKNSAVREIHVECGQLDAIVPDSLRFLFDSIKSEQCMAESELLIQTIPVICECKDCKNSFGLDLPVFICPECGSGNIEVVQGRGIRLTKIEATDSKGESDGNPDCT